MFEIAWNRLKINHQDNIISSLGKSYVIPTDHVIFVCTIAA